MEVSALIDFYESLKRRNSLLNIVKSSCTGRVMKMINRGDYLYLQFLKELDHKVVVKNKVYASDLNVLAAPCSHPLNEALVNDTAAGLRRDFAVNRASAPKIIFKEVVNGILLGFAVCFDVVKYYYIYDECLPSEESMRKINDMTSKKLELYKADSDLLNCFQGSCRIQCNEKFKRKNDVIRPECTQANMNIFETLQIANPLMAIHEEVYDEKDLMMDIDGRQYFDSDITNNYISFLFSREFENGDVHICLSVCDELGRFADVHVIYRERVVSNIFNLVEGGVGIPQFVYATARRDDTSDFLVALMASNDIFKFLRFFCQSPQTFRNLHLPSIHLPNNYPFYIENYFCNLISTTRHDRKTIKIVRDAFSPLDMLTCVGTHFAPSFICSHLRHLSRMPGQIGRERKMYRHKHTVQFPTF